MINAWDRRTRCARSPTYDLPQQINANWVYDLPYGHGQKFGATSNSFVNALFGGWQLTGLARWTSGFPMSVDNGYAFPTNWELEGNAMQTAPVQTGFSRQSDGSPNMFVNPQAALAAFRGGQPGESGTRNSFRGDGFAGLDMGLNKTWKMWYCGDECHPVPLGGVQRAQPASLRCAVAPAGDRPVGIVRQLHQPADESARHAVRAAVHVLDTSEKYKVTPGSDPGGFLRLRIRSLESSAGPAQQARRQKDDRLDEFEDATHRNAEDAERQQQQPHQRIENERQKGKRPAEEEKKKPHEEREHNSSCFMIRRLQNRGSVG